MCRSLIFIVLLVSLVNCKPLESQNAATAAQSANSAALLSDPKLMAAFAQFLQHQTEQKNPAVPAQQSSSENQPQAEGAVAVTQPLVTIIPTPLVPTVVETVNIAQPTQTVVQQTAPVQAQPDATVPVTEPVVIEVAPQNPPIEVAQPSVVVVAVPQNPPITVSQQPAAVQPEPQIQVSTVVASQNLPSQALVQVQPQATPQPQVILVSQNPIPVQAQAAAPQNPPSLDARAPFQAEQPLAVAQPQVPASQPLIFQVTPPTQPQAQPVLFEQTVPVQVQPQVAPQPQNQVFVSQPQTQTVSTPFPQWPSQQLTTPQVNPQPSTIQVAPLSQENASTQRWGNVRIITRPRTYVYTPDPLTPEQQKKQAMNAKYQFSTYMDDNIKGSFLARSEVRNGLKVNGQYGYDDGFVQRTVVYEADDKGFRIVKETTSPSTKTGKLDGTATVQTIQDGTQVDYTITSKDIGNDKRIFI